MDVSERRNLTYHAININPLQVELQRSGRVPDGAGGWIEDQEITIPAQKFRLFVTRNIKNIKEVSQEGGSFQIKTWNMICPWDADVKVKDKFSANDTNYQVVSVKPIRYLGDIVSHQAVIEEVS